MSQRSGDERMFTDMVAFLQAPTWDGSKRIVQSHPELMSEAGRQMLGFLLSDRESVAWVYPGVEPGRSNIAIQLHYVVLGKCRQIGIRAAFTELDVRIGAVKSGVDDKTPLPLSAFVTSAGQDEALSVLREYPGLVGSSTAILLDELIAAARERGDLATRRRLAERRRLLDRPDESVRRDASEQTGHPWVVATLAAIGVAVVAAAVAMLLIQGGGVGRSRSNDPASGMGPTTEKTARTSPKAQPPATGEAQETAGTTPPLQTAAVAATHQTSPQSTSRPTVKSTGQASDTASPTAPPDPSPPHIDNVGTYQEGTLVFFSILFSDPNGDAEGLGFRGVNGSTWPEETHPFSNPGLGRVSPGRVDYPFDLGCGTSDEFESDVEAWIYDCTGRQSQPVVIHLACTPY